MCVVDDGFGVAATVTGTATVTVFWALSQH